MRCPSIIILLLTLLTPSCTVTVSAQDKNPFNQSRQNVNNNKSAFNQSRSSNFNEYRQKINVEYIRNIRGKWYDFNVNRGLKDPEKDVKPVGPVIMSDEDAKRERNNRQIAIDEVTTPIKDNRNIQPIAPVQEVPEQTPQYFHFPYLGTNLQVRKPQATVSMTGVSEDEVANAWERLCEPAFNNLVIDCLKLRTSLQLCDWAYLMMLRALGDAYCGKNSNEATLLMAYIYSQSGYKMRLGQANGQLHMIYASQHNVYESPFFKLDGENFYVMNNDIHSLRITKAKYPKEQSMSLWIAHNPNVPYSSSKTRTLTSQRYPDFSVTVATNKNLMPFYDSYPSSEVGGNFMTRWTMYANTPLAPETEKQLYPQLKKLLQPHQQLEAVERLLNWVQTAFIYEYDDKVWGGDRALFAEETLYYPYCDCEDRSILFTRLVRDLLGLKCILIYYPGHLAAAVAFTQPPQGDYIQVSGKRFTVCDPTYIGASVGMTMPQMDNATANVIILQ